MTKSIITSNAEDGGAFERVSEEHRYLLLDKELGRATGYGERLKKRAKEISERRRALTDSMRP
jgi:hypothetical protein